MTLSGKWVGVFTLLTFLAVPPLYADDDHKADSSASDEMHEEGHEQHGAHEHGVATLSIAAGDEGVEIMLESPAINLVGFEHAASTEEEKQKLADAKAKLEAGAGLFTMNSEAECSLKEAKVTSALLGNAEESEEEHADHEHEAGETHSDMDVSWSFACSKPSELHEVSVKLFSAFPEGLHKLRAEWITDKGASAQELDKDDTLKLN